MSKNQKESILCLQFKKQVWDYLEGRSDEFSSHLKECPRCRKRLEEAEKLLKILREDARPVPPAGYSETFWPRLRGKIAVQERRARPFSILKFNPLYYAAMTAAAAALIIWVSIRTPDNPILMASSGDTPNYIMAPAGDSGKVKSPTVNYISAPCGKEEDNVNFILPGTGTRDIASWAV
ncbi:MAG: hypothetical protein U9N73_00390 [Candidatus Auribacterota bacterium]|nr:hypothetical protein [Candidatus Auribacterota bacterium]